MPRGPSSRVPRKRKMFSGPYRVVRSEEQELYVDYDVGLAHFNCAQVLQEKAITCEHILQTMRTNLRPFVHENHVIKYMYDPHISSPPYRLDISTSPDTARTTATNSADTSRNTLRLNDANTNFAASTLLQSHE